MTRTQLNSSVWNELRKSFKGGMAADEAIRMMRSDACAEVTRCTRPQGMHTADYADLSDAEMHAVLRYIQTGVLPDAKYPLQSHATAEQVSKLRWLCMECALTQFTFVGIDFEEEGITLTGDALKHLARARWMQKRLRGNLYNIIHAKWIHPVLHRFLQQGGLRYKANYPKNDQYFHWSDLKFDEANYLIQRVAKMYNQHLTRGAKPIDVRVATEGRLN